MLVEIVVLYLHAEASASFRFILHARPHQSIITPYNRLVFPGPTCTCAGRQAFDDRRILWADEVRDRVSLASHPIISCEAVLLWRQSNTVQRRLQCIVAPSHHQVAYIHDDGVFEGWHVDEVAWLVGVLDLGHVSSRDLSTAVKQPVILHIHLERA